MMGVFNNLVMFDQHVKQNSLQSIVPDLATGWSWNEDGTELTFPLRQGVKWHDGKPFTAADVKCTWDLMTEQVQREAARQSAQIVVPNLDEVTTNGDYEVTFHLKRPQPAFSMLLAGGFSPIYPCHVPPRRCASIRSAPARSNSSSSSRTKTSRWRRNPDYWKPDRPYLDGIEYTIIRNPSTAMLAFAVRQVRHDVAVCSLTIPLLKEVQSQMPQAICEVAPSGDINRAPARQPRRRRPSTTSICAARWR